MNRDKLKTQDILVLALAVLTVAVCLIVLIPNFSHRNDMAAVATPEPTAEPTPIAEATPEPTAEPTPEPTPEANPNEELSRAMMESMSIEEKVWQLFLATPESLTGVDVVTISGDGMQSGLETYPVGGLVYSSQNIESETQLSEMLAGAQDRAAMPLLLAYDNSAGSASIALDGNMRSLGFNLGLSDNESSLIYAATYSEGMALDGVAAVIAPTTAVEQDGEQTESESGETATLPFFLSSDHMAALRGQDGWSGMILSPLLTGGVEGYSDGELAVAALNAGCDMLCAPSDLAAAGQAVIDAINGGELSLDRVNESVQRILFAKLEAGIITGEIETESETEPAAEAEVEPAPETEVETAPEAESTPATETGAPLDDDVQSTRG